MRLTGALIIMGSHTYHDNITQTTKRELVNGLGKPVHVHTAGRLGMSGESGRGMP